MFQKVQLQSSLESQLALTNGPKHIRVKLEANSVKLSNNMIESVQGELLPALNFVIDKLKRGRSWNLISARRTALDG